MEDQEQAPSLARAWFKWKVSSTKGGGQGFECFATSDATKADADNAFHVACRMRQSAGALLREEIPQSGESE